eukprot:6160029-Prymnesium_polylepis.1
MRGPRRVSSSASTHRAASPSDRRSVFGDAHHGAATERRSGAFDALGGDHGRSEAHGGTDANAGAVPTGGSPQTSPKADGADGRYGATGVPSLSLQSPNEEASYVYRRNGASRFVCAITVHFHADLHMAPLQIRYTPPGGSAEHQRRVVVQLAPTQAPAPGAKAAASDGALKASADAIEGGLPVVYEPSSGETLQSGWVTYVVGTKGGRAQGLVTKAFAGARGKGSGGGGDVMSELASRWIDRLQEQTEELVSDAVGQIRDVQAALVYGASQQIPIRELSDNPMASGTAAARDETRLMLRSVCGGADPVVRGYYDEMCEIVRTHGQSNANLLAQMLPDKDGSNDDNRPKAFYQVAMDLPGYGQSEGTPMEQLVTVKLLTEVIRSLAKQHAFAIVAHGQSSAALLQSLLQEPKLT